MVSGLLSLARTLGQLVGISVMGAVWSSRTAAVAGGLPAGGAPAAPVAAQISGLHDVFVTILCLMLFGLALGVWALWEHRRTRDNGEASIIVGAK